MSAQTTPVAGSAYPLNRDEAERNRLNIQFDYMNNAMLEYRQIYDQCVYFEPGSKILDAGTGTGIWLMELSRKLPKCIEFFGCDISSKHFPDDIPENVHLLTASVTSLPGGWTEQFSFVNQRLLCFGLLASEWPVALSEIYRVLKPGGNVQFVDMNFSAKALNGGPHTNRLLDLFVGLMKKRNLLHDCSLRLKNIVENAGFMDIVSEKKYLPMGKAWGKVGETGKDIFLTGSGNLALAMQASGLVASESEVYILIKESREELDKSDDGMLLVGHVVYARKPLSA